MGIAGGIHSVLLMDAYEIAFLIVSMVLCAQESCCSVTGRVSGVMVCEAIGLKEEMESAREEMLVEIMHMHMP